MLKAPDLAQKPSKEPESGLRAFWRGLTSFGALLDAIGNAILLISPLTTYVGTGAAALAAAIHVLFSRTRNATVLFVIVGCVALLWVPRISQNRDGPRSDDQAVKLLGQVVLGQGPAPRGLRIRLSGFPGLIRADSNGRFDAVIAGRSRRVYTTVLTGENDLPFSFDIPPQARRITVALDLESGQATVLTQ